ncbi:integrase catalytic domain-containing protein [Bradyrhizobium japonicum]|uniref:integrase catalytic domain-containing protein n=2 Tax=Pseudomonadota TaxID=1224 RepID=UPI000428F778|nr:DDE-type integrase/transposase/recombinase [Bradyrhizobium japonicum]
MLDIVTEQPQTALPYHATEGNDIEPSLDSILFDGLEADQVVLIDNAAHRFLRKMPDQGPHLFLNVDRGEVARYSTTRLFELLDEEKYYHPGRMRLTFDVSKSLDEARALIAKAYGTINQGPRTLAETKYRYIAAFVNRMLIAPPGKPFDRSHHNADLIIEQVNAEIFAENQALPAGRKIFQPNNSSRSLLRWVKKELETQMQERACVHLNAIKARKRKLPDEIFSIIALEIRKMLDISPKFGPTKILIRVNLEISKRNAPLLDRNRETEARNAANEERIANGEAEKEPLEKPLPEAKLTTVQTEFRRYNAWIRLAKDKGKQAADLEFGGSGKFERPTRILDVAEIDHHKFDFLGILGQTPFGKAWSAAAIPRFWVCVILDTHSGYPLGLFPSFEPGGLYPALMALDNAIRPKHWLAKRFPQIRGSWLAYGKPRKIRYDNAKEFVSEQMRRALARVQIGFEHAVPHQPDTKPYVERWFGTLESDFIDWLKGSTGSSPQHRGARRPKLEAIITIDDFIMLLHMWLIEVYARRKQRGMDYDTPEERWLAGATSPSHRPQVMTKEEMERWDLIPSLEVDATTDRHGIQRDNIVYQSKQLQAMRARSGCFGPREQVPTPVRIRIPLLDVGRAIVADPTALDHGNEHLPKEFDVKSTDERAHGLNRFQWQMHRKFILAKKHAPTGHASHQEGFNHLFDTALETMGMVPLDQVPPKTSDLPDARLPRLTGVLAYGAEQPALARTEELIEKFGTFKPRSVEMTHNPRGSVKIPRVWSLETPPPDDRRQRR